MADKFGMMSEAYFKGKRELLQWATDFLKMDIPKVESLCSGAHYCQFCDAMFPGHIKMHKVNFAARTEPDYIKNWKFVQVVFGKQGIQKVIPVDRLIKGRFQDNLEFLQWFYQYFMSVYNGAEYDAEGRRKKAKGNSSIRSGGPSTARKATTAPKIRNGYANRSKKARTDAPSRAPASRGGYSGGHSGGANNAGLKELQEQLRASEDARAQLEEARAQLEEERATWEAGRQEWETKHKELENCAKAIENERDFYFNKVVEVESLCKKLPKEQAESGHVKAIIKILYYNDEADSPRSLAPAEGQAEDVEMEGGN